jgi:hypothetical protein
VQEKDLSRSRRHKQLILILPVYYRLEDEFSASYYCLFLQVSYARPSSESIRDANVYVCGLPKSLTQQELEQIFASCGKIISARIIYDNQTGRLETELWLVQIGTVGFQ